MLASCKAEYKSLIQYKYFATQLMRAHSSIPASQTEPQQAYTSSQFVLAFIISMRQVYKLIKPNKQKIKADNKQGRKRKLRVEMTKENKIQT